MSQESTSQTQTQGAAPKTHSSKVYALMTSGTIVSRVLGFVRTALLAVAIGASTTMADIFEKANVIPTVIFMLLAGGIFNVVLVPQLIKASKASDNGRAYTSKLLTLTIVVIGAATILLTLMAGPLIRILTLGWTPAMLALGTVFAYWCLPQIFFYGVYAVVGQVLNAHGRFAAFMWAPVVNNVVQIGVIGAFIGFFGAYSGQTDQLATWSTEKTLLLAGGSTLGIVSQAVVLFWPLRRLGLKLRPDFAWRGMGLRHVGKLAIWTLGSMTVGNIASLVNSRFVSAATPARLSLPDGGASVAGEYALNTSQLITVLPHSIFVLALATMYFNEFTKSFQEQRPEGIGPLLSKGLRTSAVPVVFAPVAFIVLAGPLGRLFAGSSSTSMLQGAAIGQLLLLTALGLPFKSMHFFMLRVFFADEDTKTPMIIQSIIATLCVVLAFAASIWLPATQIAAAVAAIYGGTNILSAIIAHRLLVRRYGDYGSRHVLDTYIRIGVMAALSGAVGALVLAALGGYTWGFAWSSIPAAFISIAVVGGVMLVVYLLLLRMIRSAELDNFLGPMARFVPNLRR
ncbi:murein biosynthesis integral membrane protein MurJ [Glutamicibacter sp. MNS18]|uniref:murein biosynthesis integral membrane protein MurJ n=1 Tax=Glutamicibacter sp. MNS18 TaxID=2989817 RepID=UPI0022354499|nr:murein biosynthesis integral membrane protein MurJ [Glutamicibacter sp. MNS18]MCW4465464.1 murein biosynthesis integral membrane protein MurJ [Glutamicibacter sp. MNS18]